MFTYVFHRTLRVPASEGVLLRNFDALDHLRVVKQRERRLGIASKARSVPRLRGWHALLLCIHLWERASGVALRALCLLAHIVGIWDAVIMVKPLGHRQELRLISEVPFSNACCCVTFLLQHLGDCALRRIQPDGSPGEKDSRNGKHPLGVTSSHHRCAGRTTHRRCIVAC